jgi:hypothetical protein
MPKVLFVFLMTSLLACNDPGPEKTNEYAKSLIGNWKLESAERDGSRTGSLDNTFFRFKDNGVMVSNFNLNGEEEEKKYQLNDEVIVQEGSPSLQYKIRNLSQSRLHLETSFMGATFRLFLVRAGDE